MKSKQIKKEAKRKLLFVVNHATFFASHRLPIAIEAQKKGYQVELVVGRSSSVIADNCAIRKIAKSGVRCHRASFRSGGMNFIVELFGVIQLFFTVLKLRPCIIHCASPKGVLYGGMVAKLTKTPSLVLSISGMGYGFTNNRKKTKSIKRSIARRVFSMLIGIAYSHNNKKIVVQNSDDERIVRLSNHVESSDVCLIRGSGVDLSLYRDVSFSKKEKIVLLPARILKDKGVFEFYMAIKQYNLNKYGWRFILAGSADCDNPSSISEKVIRRWVLEGVVEWLGHVENMTELYLKTSVVCLPSYREGMPKSLLEAAAAGCAVITTDTIGCREAIKPGVSGDLVPVGSAEELAKTIEQLIRDSSKVERYGRNGQMLAKKFFDIDFVIEQTLSIYQKIDRDFIRRDCI